MAETYPPRRNLHEPPVHHWALLRALLGGVMAIVLLTALVAGMTGAVLYAIALVFTKLLG